MRAIVPALDKDYLIAVEYARKLVLEHTPTLVPCLVPLQEAFSYTLAEDIFSSYDIPAFEQSNVDGYAFCYEDVNQGTRLLLREESAAGNPQLQSLKRGEVCRIFTGAPLPKGADTVIMQEFVKVDLMRNDQEIFIELLDPSIQFGKNVRNKGAEIRKGDIALKRDSLLNARTLGFLASLGISHVKVFEKPSIRLIVTGNELQKPGQILKNGQVFESNSFAIKAALQELNIEIVETIFARDHLEDIKESIEKSLPTDLLLISGGISVGNYDFTAKALRETGFITLFHGVKQKPGKPLFFGKKNQTLVFGLPGNPASVLSCLYQYVIPAIEVFSHRKPYLIKAQARLAHPFSKQTGFTHFLKGIFKDGMVEILSGQESFKLSSLAIANCWVELADMTPNFWENELVPIHILP